MGQNNSFFEPQSAGPSFFEDTTPRKRAKQSPDFQNAIKRQQHGWDSEDPPYKVNLPAPVEHKPNLITDTTDEAKNSPEFKVALGRAITNTPPGGYPETDKPEEEYKSTDHELMRKPHEAFIKSINDQILGSDDYWKSGQYKKDIREGFSAKNPMIQGAAHPQTAGDILNLLVPGELPRATGFMRNRGSSAFRDAPVTPNRGLALPEAKQTRFEVGPNGTARDLFAEAPKQTTATYPNRVERTRPYIDVTPTKSEDVTPPVMEKPSSGKFVAPIKPPPLRSKNVDEVALSNPKAENFKPSFDPAKFGRDPNKEPKFTLHMDRGGETKPTQGVSLPGEKVDTTTGEVSFDDAIKKVTQDLTVGKEVPPLRAKEVLKGQGTRNIIKDERGEIGKNIGGDVNLPEEDRPEFARSGLGGIKVGQNIKRSAQEVTTGYSRPLEAIMVREGMQNAIDAVRHLDEKGHIKVTTGDDFIEISDNGKGMNRDQLETVFSDLYESGKTSESGATGGKGIGKASYILGGKEFRAKTVTMENGEKVEYTIQGTPDEFMEHVPIQRRVLSNEEWKRTPTGTTINTKFKEGQERYNAHDMIDNVLNHTRGVKAKVSVSKYNRTPQDLNFSTGEGDTVIGQQDFDGNEVKVSVPKDDKLDNKGTYIQVQYLNNGMYQFDRTHYLDAETPNMPSKLIVDIHPTAEEGSSAYPFPTQRESIKDNLHNEIKDFIDKTLVNPQAAKKKNTLVDLYASMSTGKRGQGHGRNEIFFDPGKRLTNDEAKHFQDSTHVEQLTQETGNLIDDILFSVNHPEWSDRLEGTGIVLDRNMLGVHIPNPGTKKSSILVNYFEHMMGKEPEVAALDSVITSLHEVAHIGTENTGTAHILQSDLKDPRIGRYLQSYMQQVMSQGGLDMGHGFGFIKRLGEVYVKFGPENAFKYADKFFQIFTDGTGRYSREIQKLLRVYEESRRRPEVTTDFLSGTGTKQANRESRGTGNVSGNAEGLGGRTATFSEPNTRPTNEGKLTVGLPKDKGFFEDERGALGVNIGGVRERLNRGANRVTEEVQREGGGAMGVIRTIGNTAKSMKSTADLSALRQAAFLVHKKEFWTNIKPMIKMFGNEEYAASQASRIRNNPNFEFKQEHGLKFTDDLTREEAFLSPLADDIPAFGKITKGSNRAFSGFLNNVRDQVSDRLLDTATALGKDPAHSDALSNAIMNYVNNASGRGSLNGFEHSARTLNAILFSPRLMASRFHMMNPVNYVKADPFVRKEMLKSLGALFGGAVAVATIADMVPGVQTSFDPTNADFLKIRKGNTRLDILGGAQQFAVLYSRIALRQITSSTTGKTTRLGQGYKPDTAKTLVEGFFENKLSPIGKYASQGLEKWTGGKDFNGQEISMPKETLELFTPMILDDMKDILNDDPTALPFIVPAIFGASLQTYKPKPNNSMRVNLPPQRINLPR